MTILQTPRVAVAAGLLCAAVAQAQTCVQIEVQNVRPEQGMLMVAAYGDAADFNKKPAAAMQQRPASETLAFSMCGLNGPFVALTLYQDLNGNGKLDTNVLGIPSEPWGASGKPSSFSAPTWETTQVSLNGAPIVVKLSK